MDDIAPILRTPFVEDRTLDAGSPGGPVDHGVQAGARLSEACTIVRRGLTGPLQLD
jgi:hypothetical protein